MFRQRCQQVKGVMLASGLVGMLLAAGLLASAAAAVQQPPLAEERPGAEAPALTQATAAAQVEQTTQVAEDSAYVGERPGNGAIDKMCVAGDGTCENPNNIRGCRQCKTYETCVDCCWTWEDDDTYKRCQGRCEDKFHPCDPKQPEQSTEK